MKLALSLSLSCLFFPIFSSAHRSIALIFIIFATFTDFSSRILPFALASLTSLRSRHFSFSLARFARLLALLVCKLYLYFSSSFFLSLSHVGYEIAPESPVCALSIFFPLSLLLYSPV